MIFCRCSAEFAQGFGDGFGFGVDMQLFVNMPQVKGNGIDADATFADGRLVVVPFNLAARCLANPSGSRTQGSNLEFPVQFFSSRRQSPPQLWKDQCTCELLLELVPR